VVIPTTTDEPFWLMFNDKTPMLWLLPSRGWWQQMDRKGHYCVRILVPTIAAKESFLYSLWW
jgi:hypothetical protein